MLGTAVKGAHWGVTKTVTSGLITGGAAATCMAAVMGQGMEEDKLDPYGKNYPGSD